jgi:hypothetical protein
MDLFTRRRGVDQEFRPRRASVSVEDLRAHGFARGVAAGRTVISPHHHEAAVGQRRDGGSLLDIRHRGVDEKFGSKSGCAWHIVLP